MAIVTASAVTGARSAPKSSATVAVMLTERFEAHDAASVRRRRPKRLLLERHPELAAHVQAWLEAKDSPMTIAVELTQGRYPGIGVTVSHKTIYQAVYDPSDEVPLEGFIGVCIARGDYGAVVVPETRQTGGSNSRRSDCDWRSLMSGSRAVIATGWATAKHVYDQAVAMTT